MPRDSAIQAHIQQFIESLVVTATPLECVVFDGAVARAKDAEPLAIWPRGEPQFIDQHLEGVDQLFAHGPASQPLIEQRALVGGELLVSQYLPLSQLLVTAIWRAEDDCQLWLQQWRSFDCGSALASEHTMQSDQLGLHLARKLLQANDYPAAVQGWLADLNSLADAQRTLLFTARSGRLALDSVSGIGQFESQRHLLALAAAAAEEAFDQQCAVVDGDDRDSGLTRLAQQDFNREFAPLRVSIVPLFDSRDEREILAQQPPIGAVVLLHREPIVADLADQLGAAIAASSAALFARKRLHRSFIAGLKDDGRRFVAGLLGRELLRAKLIALGIALALLVAALWPVDEQLSISAELLPEQQQRISAQLDGYLRSSAVKEGDRVEQGQLLAELDSRDLVLERLQRLSHYSRLESEYLQAVAFGAQGEMAVLQARLNEAEAELELVDQQLQRLRITAPSSALVISGDLSQRLGDPVRAGELLFLLASLDNFKVRLKIPEYRMDAIALGVKGELFLNARSGQSYRFEVTAIKPQLIAEEGGNFLVVDGRLMALEDAKQFQPGMVGVARLEVGRASALAVWTRQLNFVVSRFLWRWFGIA